MISQSLGQELYCPETGGCRDGLHVDRSNENQGAESMLAFLLSLTEMRQIQNAAGAFPRFDLVAPITPCDVLAVYLMAQLADLPPGALALEGGPLKSENTVDTLGWKAQI